MQEVAKSRGMEVIPLVQTFGHMEVRQTSRCCLQMFVALNFLDGLQCSQCMLSVVVRVEASDHVEPEGGGTLCGHLKSPQRGGGEVSDGDAEAGGGAASGSKHATHWSG